MKYYKGTLTFTEEPDPEALEIAVGFFRQGGGQLALMEAGDSPDETPAPLSRTFYLAVSPTDDHCLPGWVKELFGRYRRNETDDEVRLMYHLDRMKVLFNAEATAEECVPSIGKPEELKQLNNLDSHRFHPFEETTAKPREHGDAEQPEHAERTIDEDALAAALAELDALIGLNTVKQQIRDIAAIVRNRGADALPCLHTVFTGNPGTGKTEAARIFARVLKALGVADGSFVETDRAGLVGRYVGETAQKTTKVIRRTKGGVLFIDEAYSLGAYAPDLGMDSNGSEGRQDFGPEAIDTLVKAMEDMRGELVVIMAGYPRQMEQMISLNPGLRDRVGFYVDFPDYSADELLEIAAHMTAKRKLELEPAAREYLAAQLAQVSANADRDFSNARLVRKIVERAAFKHDVRTADNVLAEEDCRRAFEDEDLKKVAAPPAPQRRPIGFAA